MGMKHLSASPIEVHYVTTLLAGGVSFWKCPMRTFLIHLLDAFDARISGELCTWSEEKHLPIYLRALQSNYLCWWYAQHLNKNFCNKKHQQVSNMVLLCFINHHCPFISPPQTRPWHRGSGWAFLIPIGYRSWVGTLPAFVFIVDELCPTAAGVLLCFIGWLVGGKNQCLAFHKTTLYHTSIRKECWGKNTWGIEHQNCLTAVRKNHFDFFNSPWKQSWKPSLREVFGSIEKW